MSSTILNITFDCADPGAQARFWGEVTGWPVHDEDPQPGREEYSVGPATDGGVRLYFVSVPERKTIKNRVHLDIVPAGGQYQEVTRLVGLGAQLVADQPPGVGWVVMADPEGNEFCVEG